MTTATMVLGELVGTNDPAIGPEAQEVRKAVNEARKPDTIVYDACADWPIRLARALGQANGAAVDFGAVTHAVDLLQALPIWVPVPDIEIESDGQVGFDWLVGPDRVLTLNVSRDAMIGYAARIGVESDYGRLTFAGELPERVANILGRILEQSAAG